MSLVLVIGNGAAGTFSSWLLARRGWEVILAGRGTPCSSMSTGCLRSAPRECPAEIMEFLRHDD
ncbi:MAG TPA: FAD-dependent oxidoreductase, partial [Methanomassiliicoccales archaeon]|nr:FAD-dependent oxidoreductase [Methanomassiliicoccales archaeon]